MHLMRVKVGGENFLEGFSPLYVSLLKSPHWLIAGGSGSGKSVACLYWLNSLVGTNQVELWVADFKKSGDFEGISGRYAAYEDCVTLLGDYYQAFQEIKYKETGKRIMLVFDEYSAFCVWLEQHDKAAFKRLQGYMAEILMQGRELPGGGSAWLWCLVQRPDSEYLAKGSRINYMVRICMGSVSRETKTMLFDTELPENYTPRTGCGVISEDGKPIRVFTVPNVEKSRLKRLLQKKAASAATGGAGGGAAAST